MATAGKGPVHLIGTTILERPADDDYSDEDSDEDEDDLVDPEELKVPCLNAVRTVFGVSAGRGVWCPPWCRLLPPTPPVHTHTRTCVRACDMPVCRAPHQVVRARVPLSF